MAIRAAGLRARAQLIPTRDVRCQEGSTEMTGSISAVILIPIVVTISLAAWLIVVFYADSHPRWRSTSSPVRSNPARPHGPGPGQTHPPA
jgi:hypothetical protein